MMGDGLAHGPGKGPGIIHQNGDTIGKMGLVTGPDFRYGQAQAGQNPSPVIKHRSADRPDARGAFPETDGIAPGHDFFSSAIRAALSTMVLSVMGVGEIVSIYFR